MSLGRSGARSPSLATWSMVDRAWSIALMRDLLSLTKPVWDCGPVQVQSRASGAEDAGGDPEACGGGGESGVLLGVGDLSGDLAELCGDG